MPSCRFHTMPAWEDKPIRRLLAGLTPCHEVIVERLPIAMLKVLARIDIEMVLMGVSPVASTFGEL